jgi:hypothetical protein
VYARLVLFNSPSVPTVSSSTFRLFPRPTPSLLPLMATASQTEQVYDGHKSVGVAVSPPPIFAHRA